MCNDIKEPIIFTEMEQTRFCFYGSEKGAFGSSPIIVKYVINQTK